MSKTASELAAEVAAETTELEARGTSVVNILARVGIPATYENRQAPMVSLHLEDAEALAAAVNAVDAAWPCWLPQRIRRYHEAQAEIAKAAT